MEAWYVFAFLALIGYLIRSLRAKNIPPGPWGLPLLGHLHLLGELPHQNLQKLAKKYGPIMSIRLGLIPTVVITSPKYAELFLKTHDVVFASRPRLQAADHMAYGQKNMVMAQYGPYWRNIRKLCTIELLTSSKIEIFRPMRKDEVSSFVQSLRKESETGSEVDVTARIESLIENMTYRMIFGAKGERLNLKSAFQEGVRIAGLFNIADFVPYLGGLDIQGLGPKMKAVTAVLDHYLEKSIDEHMHNAKEEPEQHRDFTDIMLSLMESNNTRELQLGRDNIKAIMIDMLGASLDTTSTTIEWVIAELLKHPRCMKLVQAELEKVVGLERMVEETDLIKLEYLKLVIKESLRIHPVAPLLIPHESTEDITINGYFIPKKSRVLINTWAIGRDPNVWSDNAQEFYPERFIGADINIEGHDFRLLPFGSGRRMCPGLQLGLTVVELVVSQLVHCFNLELPLGMLPSDLDMTEKFGLTLPRANHLVAIPSYRLHTEL